MPRRNSNHNGQDHITLWSISDGKRSNSEIRNEKENSDFV